MAINFNKDNFKADKKENTLIVKYSDKDIYAANLPEGVDVKTAKEVFKYNSEFINEATKAAVDYAKANFDGVEKVMVETPFGPTGTGHVDTVIEKERTFKNPTTGEEVTKPYIRVAVKHTQLKASKSMLKELSEEIANAIANK